MDSEHGPVAVEQPTDEPTHEPTNDPTHEPTQEHELLQPAPADDTTPVTTIGDELPYTAASPPPPGGPPDSAAGPPAAAPTSRRWIVLAVLVALVSGSAAGAIAGRVSSHGTKTIVDSSPGGRIANPTDIHAVLAKVEPGVVSIKTEAYQAGTFFPQGGAGTGMVLTADGEVLTNAHVVNGASSITVTLQGQSAGRQADVVGIDANNDIALLKIRNATALATVTLGNSSSLRVGDSVVAIGNALDLTGGPTVTEGIVSAINRSIQTSTESLSGLIQTDAAINPGNSGGPLVDSSGRVVAMSTAVAGAAQNIGFAIAIDRVKPVVESLRRDHTGARQSTNPTTGGAFLGVSTQAGPDGAVVTSVTAGAPAGQAGMQAGDVILSVDGRSISGPVELAAAIRTHQPGDKVQLRWRHNGTVQTTTVTLITRPSP
jgi:putative serine protease PepD